MSFSSIRRPEQDGDLRAATQRWKKAGSCGNVDAMVALAFAYEGGGPGLAKDEEAASAWKARAEEAALERVEEVEEKPLPIKRGFIESSGDTLITWR